MNSRTYMPRRSRSFLWNVTAATCVGVRMQHRQVIVLKNKGQWVIRSQKVANQTTFETQEAALKAAVDVAQKLGKDGEPAKVMLCDVKTPRREVFNVPGRPLSADHQDRHTRLNTRERRSADMFPRLGSHMSVALGLSSELSDRWRLYSPVADVSFRG